MIWWLHEIDKFYNNLKKRVLRGKSATDGTMKKKFMGQKNYFHEPKKIVPGKCNQFLFFIFFIVCEELFWLADPRKKKTNETLHTPQIEVWRCFPLGHLCKL